MVVKTTKQLISVLTANVGMTVAELSRRLGVSPQFLNNRIKTEKFSLEEWDEVIKTCGAIFEIHVQSIDGNLDIILKPTK